MRPQESRPRTLPRLDRALWTWRLSGKAGGTGNGYAVTYKITGRATSWNAARPATRQDLVRWGWAAPLPPDAIGWRADGSLKTRTYPPMPAPPRWPHPRLMNPLER